MAMSKSAISVGLLHIPIALQKSTRDISISFNQICKDTGARVKYKKICPNCDKEVSSNDLIKGYEFEKGQYVTITQEELDRIKTKKDKTIHILHFAKMAEIDSIYFEKNYYCIPQPMAEKAFELLRQAMLSKKTVAVAKTVLGNGTKEDIVVLYPTKEGIIAKFLFYQEEIQAMPNYTRSSVNKDELQMAKTLIDSMTKAFDATAYRDEYQERLRDAINKKIMGKEIINVDTEAPDNIIDLMDALQKTVEMQTKGA